MVLTALSASVAGPTKNIDTAVSVNQQRRTPARLALRLSTAMPDSIDLSRRDEWRRRSQLGIVRMMLIAEQGKNSLHIAAGFRVRRHPAVLVDDGLAGVVRGGGKGDLAAIIRQEPAQIRQPAAHVVSDIEGVPDSESGCRVGDELHQPPSILWRSRVRVEVRLDGDDGKRKPWRYRVSRCSVFTRSAIFCFCGGRSAKGSTTACCAGSPTTG